MEDRRGFIGKLLTGVGGFAAGQTVSVLPAKANDLKLLDLAVAPKYIQATSWGITTYFNLEQVFATAPFVWEPVELPNVELDIVILGGKTNVHLYMKCEKVQKVWTQLPEGTKDGPEIIHRAAISRGIRTSSGKLGVYPGS